MKSAHAFPKTYERMGIDLRDLGCLMLNTENPVDYVHQGTPYVSPDPKKFWVKGRMDHWHVTVRYGFLDGVNADDVDSVLAEVGEFPSKLTLVSTEIFPSPYPEEQYDTLVARVEDKRLNKINQALSVLPNVNTFPEYKAHITIGTFETGRTDYVSLKRSVKTLGLDYGQNLRRNND